MLDKNNTRAVPARPAPWHLWLVSVLLLAWNVMSCFSQVMTLSQNTGYFQATGVTPAIAAYFAALPAWCVALWTIGVWGGALAAIGLLSRKSWAVWWSAASQLAMVAYSLATLSNPTARQVLGQVGTIMSAAVVAIGIFMVFYSFVMRRRGILR